MTATDRVLGPSEFQDLLQAHSASAKAVEAARHCEKNQQAGE